MYRRQIVSGGFFAALFGWASRAPARELAIAVDIRAEARREIARAYLEVYGPMMELLAKPVVGQRAFRMTHEQCRAKAEAILAEMKREAGEKP